MFCSLQQVAPAIAELQQSPWAQYVAHPSSDIYQNSLTSYFSQQEQELHPAVIVTPSTTEDVSEILKIIAKHHQNATDAYPCLAIRSGGKTPQAGVANVQDGITIDLGRINATTIAADRQTVEVGTGARWGDVYTVLDAAGLGVSGGRDSTIGVGGLTLGGGLSLFGPERGFVCDDVASFEVVLASGEVVEASQQHHPDLWRALKGGSNNFGIVTKFTFGSFELGQIWGGQNVYPGTTSSQHLDAIYNFTADPSPDPYATVIQSFSIRNGSIIAVEGLKYTRPVENPPSLAPFLAIQPTIYSSNKITTMTAAAIEQAGYNTLGRRQALTTTTFINDRSMLQYAFDTWAASVPSVKDLTDVRWSLTFQPLPPSITQKGQKFGGNVLGLEGAPPLIVAQIAISWDDPANDALVDKALAMLNNFDKESMSRGLFHRYKYLPYSWSSQDPIDGYGAANKAFLQAVSKKYDPTGLFQTGVPGGFKLFH